jgi:hypothetical protein
MHTLYKLRLVSKEFNRFFTCKEFWYPIARYKTLISKSHSQIPVCEDSAPFQYICNIGLTRKIRYYNKRIGITKRQITNSKAKICKIQELIEKQEKIKLPKLERKKIIAEYYMLQMQLHNHKDFETLKKWSLK